MTPWRVVYTRRKRANELGPYHQLRDVHFQATARRLRAIGEPVVERLGRQVHERSVWTVAQADDQIADHGRHGSVLEAESNDIPGAQIVLAEFCMPLGSNGGKLHERAPRREGWRGKERGGLREAGILP